MPNRLMKPTEAPTASNTISTPHNPTTILRSTFIIKIEYQLNLSIVIIEILWCQTVTKCCYHML